MRHSSKRHCDHDVTRVARSEKAAHTAPEHNGRAAVGQEGASARFLVLAFELARHPRGWLDVHMVIGVVGEEGHIDHNGSVGSREAARLDWEVEGRVPGLRRTHA